MKKQQDEIWISKKLLKKMRKYYSTGRRMKRIGVKTKKIKLSSGLVITVIIPGTFKP
jgi:hypothetical protein